MEEVGFHGRCFAKPALRHRMFAVVAIAFTAVAAALVGRVCKVAVGVYVPYLTIAAKVGLLICTPEVAVAYGGVGRNDGV